MEPPPRARVAAPQLLAAPQYVAAPQQADTRSYHRQMRQLQDRGVIHFGDDSSPQQRGFETTNAASQAAVQRSHEFAKARHEEKVLVGLLIEQHGMSPAEARQELMLFRQKQAQLAGRPPAGGVPSVERPPPQAQPWYRQYRPVPPPPRAHFHYHPALASPA